MKVNGLNYPTLEVFPTMMTVPDCLVKSKNKLGTGHGEAKIYVASKEDMRNFYGEEGFTAKCFMLKRDLIAYMEAIKSEYEKPSQEYSGKAELPNLWVKRMAKISSLPDVIAFTVHDQYQIAGPRGYLNSTDKGYDLIREISLPLVSYIYTEKVGDKDNPLFYWKLFVDFDAIWERQTFPLVFTYGNRLGDTEEDTSDSDQQETPTEQVIATLKKVRVGQDKYRAQLLEQCPYCPFTMISDERLLIASHIKPWTVSNEKEKIDPYNGFMLSPLYDSLFDKGFITITKDKHIILSDFISSSNWKRMGIVNNKYYQMIPMDDRRYEYLKFHHESVFKGNFSDIVGA